MCHTHKANYKTKAVTTGKGGTETEPSKCTAVEQGGGSRTQPEVLAVNFGPEILSSFSSGVSVKLIAIVIFVLIVVFSSVAAIAIGVVPAPDGTIYLVDINGTR